MPEDLQTIADSLLNRSRVDRPHRRLYCLGPNVGRISFLSQQLRALNLVWALSHENLIKKNDKVAVVGAGLSGVTAAVALRAHDCTVRIFDNGGRPLHRQRLVTHRSIYPNINWWPGDEAGLLATAELPFLGWRLGTCKGIVKDLETDWKRLTEESGNDLLFIRNKIVTSAVPEPANENRLIVTLDNREEYRNFDIVIVASGFGEERKFLDFERVSYWESDDLEGYRDGSNGKDQIIVSGFGDGGLIDALRCAYDFNFGELSWTTAQLLSGTDVADEIAIIESSRDNPRTWKRETARYEELAQQIIDDPEYDKVKDALNDALYERAAFVILVDKDLANPYQSPAAPIHKLLVAYAFQHSVIKYVQAEIEKKAKGKYIIGGDTYTTETSHFVIRHGAEPFNKSLVKDDEKQLIKDEEWAKLRAAQARSQEFNFKPAWSQSSQPYRVPDGWPCAVDNPKAFIERHVKMAQDVMSFLSPGSWVQPAGQKFVVINYKGEFKPETLFGKEIAYIEKKDLETAEVMV